MILSLCGPLIQTEIADFIMVKKQNLTNVVRELEQWGYIDLYKIEGKNKFYRAATNDERIEQILAGQQDMFVKIKVIQKNVKKTRVETLVFFINMEQNYNFIICCN